VTQPRFLLDEHMPLAIAPQLRRRGIDCVTLRDAGRLGLSDVDHLDWARFEGRIIVSFDEDFLSLSRKVQAHAGVIRCTPRTREVGAIIRGLITFVSEHSAEEAANRTWYI
jgi:predicted nuclease of predicted toxin-antitoxin system